MIFRKIFMPLNFFAKYFAPLKKHSDRVSGLKNDLSLNDEVDGVAKPIKNGP